MPTSETAKINECIDRFADAMKKRMHSKRKSGWSGWDDNEYPDRLLRNAADAAINGNAKSAVDCANFCMMTWIKREVKP
jgi:hypothetical protein